MATIPTIWVPNTLLDVPAAIRYNDANGNPVYTLYPLDYLVLVGQSIANLSGSTIQIAATVTYQIDQINYLLNAISNIPPEYNTPEIAPECLAVSQTPQPIDQILTLMVQAWCDFVVVSGSIGDLNIAIATQCPNLNSDVAFAGGQMSAITGWVSSPVTLADTITNIWLTLCDARIGIQQALEQSAITCSDIIINFNGVISDNGLTLTVYLLGYTFLPEGFSSSDSTITIADSSNNSITFGINITQEQVIFDLTGAGLNPISNYTVTLNGTAKNLPVTCEKVVIKQISNTTSACPILSPIIINETSISVLFSPYILTGVNYSITIYDASGSTIITSSDIPNPTGPSAVTLSGLTTNTTYQLGCVVTLEIAGIITCNKQLFTTI